MNIFVAKNNVSNFENKIGLLYLLLSADHKILYIGSSKDLSNRRLLQCNRMRGDYISDHVTANTIGHEYEKSIHYAVKIKISDFHNVELDLINRLKPKYNTAGKKNYLSKWDNPNFCFDNPPPFISKFINDICINGIFNTSCNY